VFLVEEVEYRQDLSQVAGNRLEQNPAAKFCKPFVTAWDGICNRSSSRGCILGKTQTLAHNKTDPRNQKQIFVPKNNQHQTSVIMSSKYEQVHQVDDIEEPPVIVEMVKPMGEAQQERNIDDWNKAKCAGCVGATAGCLTGGFWLSLVCATGCLYCAKQEGTAGGDVARACGSYAIKAQVMARDVDKQHHVVQTSKEAATTIWSAVKDINQEHQIVEKTKDCVVSTAQGVGKVISVVAKEISSSTTTSSSSSSSSTTTSSNNNAFEEEAVYSGPEIIIRDYAVEPSILHHPDQQAGKR
jgi:hypothetical protein